MEFQTQFVLHPYPPPPPLPHLSPLPQHEHPYICLIFIFICPPHFILKVPIAVLIPTYKVKEIWTQGKELTHGAEFVKTVLDQHLGNDQIEHHIMYNGVNHYIPLCKYTDYNTKVVNRSQNATKRSQNIWFQEQFSVF